MMIIEFLFINMVPQRKNSNYMVSTNAQKLRKTIKQRNTQTRTTINQVLSEQPDFIPYITLLSCVNSCHLNSYRCFE
jgi:hypothetical protein